MVRLAHRVADVTEEAMPQPTQIFRMATEGSAATTPFKGEIGTLEPGKAADIVVMNWNAIAEPYLESGTPIVDAVVYRARASGVDTVIIGGECVYRDRRFTRIDKAAAMAELKASLLRPASAGDVQRRKLAGALGPHAEALYGDYLRGAERMPFYSVNSSI